MKYGFIANWNFDKPPWKKTRKFNFFFLLFTFFHDLVGIFREKKMPKKSTSLREKRILYYFFSVLDLMRCVLMTQCVGASLNPEKCLSTLVLNTVDCVDDCVDQLLGWDLRSMLMCSRSCDCCVMMCWPVAVLMCWIDKRRSRDLKAYQNYERFYDFYPAPFFQRCDNPQQNN